MNQQEANSFARKAVALCYYVQSGVPLGYCAEIAGMSTVDFIHYLTENNVFQFYHVDTKEPVENMMTSEVTQMKRKSHFLATAGKIDIDERAIWNLREERSI